MKKFDEIFEEFGHDLAPMDMASRFVASGFGIVPGGGWTQDSRVFADKKGGFSMAAPLYDMDAISVVLARKSDSPYYLALGTLGDSFLCVVDIDNGHNDAPKSSFDEMWTRFCDFANSLGCDESEIETLCIQTPGDGIHLLFVSDIAPLFSWLTAAQSDILGEGIAIDWLTPGSSQHETGPGCVRPQCSARRGGRYDVCVPAGSDTSDLSLLVKPLPVPLLRWLVEHHIEHQHAHKKHVVDCFRSPMGMKNALRNEDIADILKAGQKAEKAKTKKRTKANQATASSCCDEVGLWNTQKHVSAGNRHHATTSFAGTCVRTCTGSDFDSTCDLIEAEIRNFGEHVCEPALPVHEVASIVRDARRWAEDARADIEQRIAARVEVVGADGQVQTQVLQDFCERRINGGSYRCRRLKSGKASLPISSPVNVVEALEHDAGLAGRFGYDMLNCRNCVVSPLPWSSQDETFPRFVTDADLGRVITYIDEVAQFDPTRSFRVAFNEVCARHSFDPLADFVRGFDGRWDGQNHMGLIARYMGVDSDDIVEGHSFSETCLAMMMRGAIRRALRPGCQFDLTLVLCGDQGVGKSSFIRALACNPDWYCEDLSDIGDPKRAFEQISGSWIVNIDELSGLRSAKDVTRVKTFLTARYDDYRAPYKSERERVARRQVFLATTNEMSFLNDRSGNRRFMVVPCVGVMDERGLPVMFSDPSFDHEIEQAWAQAYAMEEADPDAPLALPLWAMKEQARRNEGASVADPIEEKLTTLFSERRLDDEPLSYAQVYAEVYDCSQSDYARERHLKSFQDLARRIAKREGWKEGRFYAYWGEQRKSQKRGFSPVLTDAERDAIRRRIDDDETLIDMTDIKLFD